MYCTVSATRHLVSVSADVDDDAATRRQHVNHLRSSIIIIIIIPKQKNKNSNATRYPMIEVHSPSPMKVSFIRRNE